MTTTAITIIIIIIHWMGQIDRNVYMSFDNIFYDLKKIIIIKIYIFYCYCYLLLLLLLLLLFTL